MCTLKNLTIVLFVCINLCCALSIKAQCNNSNKTVGALIAYGSDNGKKTPLILIHGIHGTDPSPNRTEPGHKRTEANQYWNEFKAKYVADKELTAKYVIYDFQYYSNQESVQDIACELGLFIDQKIPDRQHVILAHSMGGLVAKAYMVFYQHKSGEWTGVKGGDTVIGAITLATPHHGTHGSNDVDALKQHIGFGWKQVIDKLNFAYWSDRAGFFSPQSLASGMPNRGDLRWDNYDKAISANSLTNNDVNIWLPTANRKFEQYASKVILYAGVLRSENMANSPQAALAIAVGNPIYNDHQRLSFANDVLVNGFSNKFGPTDGLVPYKSALSCDSSSYFISPTMPNFICGSKYRVRRFEAGKWDATPNERPDANTLSIKRIPRGYDHKDMYEHPDVLLYVMSDLRGFLKNSSSDSQTLTPFGNDEKKSGYYDRKTGKIIISPRYDIAMPFSLNNLALVKIGEKYSFIDTTGKIVINSLPYDYVSSFFEDDLSLVKNYISLQNEKYKAGFIDSTGKLVIPLQFDEAYNFKEGLAAVRLGNKWGYIDKTGRFVITPQFLKASDFSEALASVQISETESGFIDKTGKFVIPPKIGTDYSAPFSYFSEGLAIIEVQDTKENLKRGFIDKQGKVVISPQFSMAFPFSEGLAAVDVKLPNGIKTGFIDRTGKFVINPRFDFAIHFLEGIATVEIGGKWGNINKNGEFIIEPKYNSGENFKNGVVVYDKVAYDREGRVIWRGLIPIP